MLDRDFRVATRISSIDPEDALANFKIKSEILVHPKEELAKAIQALHSIEYWKSLEKEGNFDILILASKVVDFTLAQNSLESGEPASYSGFKRTFHYQLPDYEEPTLEFRVTHRPTKLELTLVPGTTKVPPALVAVEPITRTQWAAGEGLLKTKAGFKENVSYAYIQKYLAKVPGGLSVPTVEVLKNALALRAVTLPRTTREDSPPRRISNFYGRYVYVQKELEGVLCPSIAYVERSGFTPWTYSSSYSSVVHKDDRGKTKGWNQERLFVPVKVLEIPEYVTQLTS